MKKKYLLLEIKYNKLDTYGKVFVILANPVKPSPTSEGYYSVSRLVGPDTELFVYPQDESIIEPICRIGNEGDLWEPNLSEFKTEYAIWITEKKIAHYHHSLFETKKNSLITFIAKQITFDKKIINKIDKKEQWLFTVDEISTPRGLLLIRGYKEVESDDWTGVKLDACGELWFRDFQGHEDEDNLWVGMIIVARQIKSNCLWVHIFDGEDQLYASICGTEEESISNELKLFLQELKKTSKRKTYL